MGLYNDCDPLAGAHIDIREVSAPAAGALSPRTARVAVYDSDLEPPTLHSIDFADPAVYIKEIGSTVYVLASQRDPRWSRPVIDALCENLVHAEFREVVVSIREGGRHITFSDQGKGIADKQAVLLPGYSTATWRNKQLIAGVGSGLPMVKHFIDTENGTLTISDNLGSGTVVELCLPPLPAHEVVQNTVVTHADVYTGQSRPILFDRGTGNSQYTQPLPAHTPSQTHEIAGTYSPTIRLNERQCEVLVVVADCDLCGPSLISELLDISLATAYRDLSHLERAGLIRAVGTGKRRMTEQGHLYLNAYLDNGRMENR